MIIVVIRLHRLWFFLILLILLILLLIFLWFLLFLTFVGLFLHFLFSLPIIGLHLCLMIMIFFLLVFILILVKPINKVVVLLQLVLFLNLMLIDQVNFCLFLLLLLSFRLLGNLQETMVLNFLHNSVNGKHEIEKEKQHYRALQNKWTVVVLPSHRRGIRQVGDVWYTFVSGQEEIFECQTAHSSLINNITNSIFDC